METDPKIKRNRRIILIICIIITLAVPPLTFFFADDNSIIFPIICGILLLFTLKARIYLAALFPVAWFAMFMYIISHYCDYAILQIDNRTGKTAEVKIDYDFYNHSLGVFEPNTFTNCEVRRGVWDLYSYDVLDNDREIDTVLLTISADSLIYNIAGAETYKIDYKQYGGNSFMPRTKEAGFPKYTSDKIIDLDKINYNMRYIFETPPDTITVKEFEQFSGAANAIGHDEYYIVRTSEDTVEKE